MQKNDYLLAKFGVDTAENEPLRARHRARPNIGAGMGGHDAKLQALLWIVPEVR